MKPPWWIEELQRHWGNGEVDHDTRRAAKAAIKHWEEIAYAVDGEYRENRSKDGFMENEIELDDRSIVALAREHLSKDNFDRLTFKESVPLFPQATYTSSTYELKQFVKAIRSASPTEDSNV